MQRPEEASPEVTLARAPGTADPVALSTDGTTLAAVASSAEGDVRIGLWDTRTGATRLWLDAPSHAHALAFSADGHWLAAGGDSQDLTLWDLRSRRVFGLQHDETADRVHSVAFAPDGRTLYAGGRFFGLRAWDLATRRPRQLVAGGLAVHAIAPSPDGRRLAFLRGHWGLGLLVVEAETGRRIWSRAER